MFWKKKEKKEVLLEKLWSWDWKKESTPGW